MQESTIATYLRYAICTDCCTDEMRPVSYNMYKSGYTQYNSLYNLADLIAMVFIGFGLVPLVSVIRSLLPKAPIVDNCDRFVRGRFLIIIINVTYLRVAFAAILNFTSFNPDLNRSSSFNSFASIALISYVALVPLYYAA